MNEWIKEKIKKEKRKKEHFCRVLSLKLFLSLLIAGILIIFVTIDIFTLYPNYFPRTCFVIRAFSFISFISLLSLLWIHQNNQKSVVYWVILIIILTFIIVTLITISIEYHQLKNLLFK